MLQGIKQIMGTLPIVIILSTITWVVFYYVYPDAPLEPNETLFIVLVWTFVTLIFKALVKRKVSKPKPAQEEPENESA